MNKIQSHVRYLQLRWCIVSQMIGNTPSLFSVSDFSQQLSLLNEQHAEKLQLLVGNLPKAKLRAPQRTVSLAAGLHPALTRTLGLRHIIAIVEVYFFAIYSRFSSVGPCSPVNVSSHSCSDVVRSSAASIGEIGTPFSVKGG